MRHSWVRFVGSIVVVLGLVAPASAADWSAYIDHDAQRSVAQKPTVQKRTKVGKRTTKTTKKVAKAKARAKKSKTRRK